MVETRSSDTKTNIDEMAEHLQKQIRDLENLLETIKINIV